MVSINQVVDHETKVAIVGLGYVGLPLAIALSKHADVIGFDNNPEKISQLIEGVDVTGESSPDDLKDSRIEFTSDPARLQDALFLIVTVPTPIDQSRRPDLSCLEAASRTIGANLQDGAIVVFESTVYPGVTEEVCAPIIEQASGLSAGKGFKVGYSPERINPGDKVHTIDKIIKVVSGQDDESLETIARLYELVVTAGVHRASSIKVAEAAKVIENTQRDLNIALMNELALIFNRLDIPTNEVLEAAGTKWNFLKFTPGLVGGHCIGVDPYYLTYKAEEVGYQPQVILAGRRINDSMGKFIAEMTVKNLIKADKAVKGARVLVLGLTFKENVPDVRNSKVVDIVDELESYGVEVLVHDPVADKKVANTEYGIELVDIDTVGKVDGVICAVAHDSFLSMSADRLQSFFKDAKGVFVDVKNIYKQQDFAATGIVYWSL